MDGNESFKQSEELSDDDFCCYPADDKMFYAKV